MSEVDPNGQTLTWQYDLAGRQISETDADGGNSTTTTDSYDDAGNLLTQTLTSGSASPSATTYQYDKDGNETQQTDADGRIITYSYDAEGRETGEKWYASQAALNSNSPSNVLSYSYDADGDLLTAGDNNSSYTFGYDDAGRLQTVSNANTPNMPQVVLTDGYGDVGQGARGDDLRTSLAVAGAGVSYFTDTFEYDQNDNLTYESQTGSNVAAKSVTFGYDADNNFASITRSGGANSTYGYDLDGRITSLNNTTLAGATIDDFGWTYDSDDRVHTFSSSVDGTATYGYDADGQLTSASYTGRASVAEFFVRRGREPHERQRHEHDGRPLQPGNQ